MEAGEGPSSSSGVSSSSSSQKKRQAYPPHLKKVLKSYQAAATTSLHGPNSVMGAWAGPAAPAPPVSAEKPTPGAEPPKPAAEDFDPLSAPPPFPIQQPPIFTPADQGRCEASETLLEGEAIACFAVGGEARLCLPQILNSVLRDFSLAQINSVCDALHIFCSRCNAEQLETLKGSGVLPPSAPSCGLITKTDAERLCAALVGAGPPAAEAVAAPAPGAFRVRVVHECFGGCAGLYAPELYREAGARCIACAECGAALSPRRFVLHAHGPAERRTCHWGFDSARWRAYVLLAEEDREDPRLQEVLKEMKGRFDADHKYKRKQILSESCDPSTKRVRAEGWYPYSYAFDPTLVYWYTNPLWNKTAAFKPLPPVITKDGKSFCIPQEALPFFKDRLDPQYEHNLALTPANVQKLGLIKMPDDTTVIAYHSRLTESGKQLTLVKKDADYESNACLDSEDAFSDTSFSTLSDQKLKNLGDIKSKQSLSGTEEGLPVVCEENEEPLPSVENELEGLNKLVSEVDDSLRSKILAEVESLIAKYRKCLSNAMQGKKRYQTELERVQNAQRAKILRLREKNKDLEETVRKLQGSQLTVNVLSEHSETPNVKLTAVSPNSLSLNSETDKTRVVVVSSSDGSLHADGNDSITDTAPPAVSPRDAAEEEKSKTVLRLSPSLPNQSPNPVTEPLGK